jgi:hypothetical protein
MQTDRQNFYLMWNFDPLMPHDDYRMMRCKLWAHEIVCSRGSFSGVPSFSPWIMICQQLYTF